MRRHRPYRGKRVVDLTITCLVAVPAAVLCALSAAAIYLDSGRPILFRQGRVGLLGRPFVVIKFRTMIDEPNPVLAEDWRITRAGRFLRRTALDELPQLINVLRGEMSLVGPRPALPYQTARFTERQRARLSVRPGMTGLAAVRGRNTLTWAERIELDLEYVERQSPSYDVRILLETVGVVAGGTGVAGYPAEDPISADEESPVVPEGEVWITREEVPPSDRGPGVGPPLA